MSQSADPNPNEVSIPRPTKETLLVVNVKAGATREDIAKAIGEALQTIDFDPFFQYATPKHMDWLRSGAGKGPDIPLGKGLQIMVRHEGP